MFVAAAAFSLREGIDELIHPSATSSFAVAYIVLAISAVAYHKVPAVRTLEDWIKTRNTTARSFKWPRQPTRSSTASAASAHASADRGTRRD